ncbi:TraR/DksA family transcriptional regulator [Kordiimonas aestuarii]|uniref:TraR/DksA family transcriptional regulator n=1 Tax=Kordiimonas aestuarii TaxID=1005925 RepID=UPI0021CED69A|nr:TraR/DksA C4-type zinc finger protein [Kordiimonas aestuarii]
MNNAIAVRRRQALQRLDAALKRLRDGEFGYCLECGEEIALRRLELDPTVTFCTECPSRT